MNPNPKPKDILIALARHAMANTERVFISLSVVRDADFVTVYGHEVFGLATITIPESVEKMIRDTPETVPPAKISLDELRLVAARDALDGLLRDGHAGVGPWRKIATARVDQIDAMLEQVRAK